MDIIKVETQFLKYFLKALGNPFTLSIKENGKLTILRNCYTCEDVTVFM